MTIRAVLFDIGGPIATEIEYEQAIDRDIITLFSDVGVTVTSERYVTSWRRAVDSFAPDAYHAVVADLAHHHDDLTAQIIRQVRARSHERGLFELRPGVAELLEELHARGLKLGLAANQPAEVIGRMEAAGIAKYFASQAVSGTLGFHKPDPRLFLHACEALGVEPAECIMVGDRIDCDIAPANALGMRTVCLRTGRHASQEPRTEAERPDAEVTEVAAMREAILRLLG
ncbi:MAG: HAD family hydrolase [Chloroflexota bacterium]